MNQIAFSLGSYTIFVNINELNSLKDKKVYSHNYVTGTYTEEECIPRVELIPESKIDCEKLGIAVVAED